MLDLEMEFDKKIQIILNVDKYLTKLIFIYSWKGITE